MSEKNRGAASIYGVRSVDADIVQLWENLEGMGNHMIEIQVLFLSSNYGLLYAKGSGRDRGRCSRKTT